MIYTIFGGILGGIVTSMYCTLRGVCRYSSGFFPSNHSLCVLMGVFGGGCAGFGYGTRELFNNNHPYQNAFKRMKISFAKKD